jgi:nitroimidazol reductase NimA-like FMN-containing flavoprotein (pyridoxamine 5'-phosphate oxidase superfamily)
MDDDLKKRITEYIDKCHFSTIATVSADGQPNASTVSFNNAGMDIYFNTTRDSKKIRNILSNPRVAIAMEKPRLPKTDQEIKGIQCSGTARILSHDEIAKAPKAVAARNRLFNSLKPGSSVIVKVTPLEIYLIDYSRGFRHRELLQL